MQNDLVWFLGGLRGSGFRGLGCRGLGFKGLGVQSLGVYAGFRGWVF